MGRLYNFNHAGNNVSAQLDIFELRSISKILRIHDIRLTQRNGFPSTKDIFTLNLKSGFTTSGAGGGSTSIKPIIFGDSVTALNNADSFNTTKASGGTIVTHRSWNWDIKAPFHYSFPPGLRPTFQEGTYIVLELATTPSATTLFSINVTVEELY